MILDELVLHNFGLYKGRQTIELRPPSARKPVILFGGMNGGGKTTLLDALQLVLYGKLANCSNRGNLSYEDFLVKCINKSIDPADGAALELQFRHLSDGDEQTYRIHRSWSVSGKGIRERLDILCNGKLDSVLTESWQEQVEEFIPVRISNLFFFDGEKIEALADPSKSSILLSTAIHSLLGLDIVDRLQADLSVIEKKKRASLRSSKELMQLKALEEKVKKLGGQIEDLKQERASLGNKLTIREKAYRQAAEVLRSEGGSLFNKKQEIEFKKKEVKGDLFSKEEELLKLASESAPILMLSELLDLVAAQDHAEDSSARAAVLVNALRERDTEVLKLASSKGLESEAVALLEQVLKEDRTLRSREVKTEQFLLLSEEGRHRLQYLLNSGGDSIRADISHRLDEVESLQSKLVDVDRRLAAVPDENAIESLIKKRERAAKDLEDIRLDIKVIDSDIGKLEAEIVSLKKEIKSALECQFEREDESRLLAHSEKVRDSLKKFRVSLVGRDVDKIQSLVLDSLQQLLRKKTLVKGIKIDPKSFEVELIDDRGITLSPNRLSAGERQLLAVALLWGLGRAVGRPLPVVIDTPLGRLDSSHRNHLVQRYFPAASHQVLLLSTDEEVDEAFYRKLKTSVGRSYLLDYDDSSESTTVVPGYFW